MSKANFKIGDWIKHSQNGIGFIQAYKADTDSFGVNYTGGPCNDCYLQWLSPRELKNAVVINDEAFPALDMKGRMIYSGQHILYPARIKNVCQIIQGVVTDVSREIIHCNGRYTRTLKIKRFDNSVVTYKHPEFCYKLESYK